MLASDHASALLANRDAPEFTLEGRNVYALVVDCYDADSLQVIMQ